MSQRYLLVGIVVVSLAIHFLFFGYPRETVFDEVYFGKFVTSYSTGEYYFDIHPPLGKLLIAGWLKVVGVAPDFESTGIGQAYASNAYLYARFVPAFLGSLLPLLLFLIVRSWGIDRKYALMGAVLVLLENAFLVQSRQILLDIPLLFFGFLAVLIHIRWPRYVWVAVLFAAMATTIKWTGVSFFVLIVASHMWNLSRERVQKPKLMAAMGQMMAVGAVVYLLSFLVHFALLPKSGPGDVAHSPEFLKTLKGSAFEDAAVTPASFWGKFTELNNQMLRSQSRLRYQHPDASSWYSWPFMGRAVAYWNGDKIVRYTIDGITYERPLDPDWKPDIVKRITFLGNPLIWWAVIPAIILTAWLCWRRGLRERVGMFILVGYVANLLPFMFITRQMFLYHYLVALMFGILAIVFVLSSFPVLTRGAAIKTYGIAVVLAFLLISPLTYGIRVSKAFYDTITPFASWK